MQPWSEFKDVIFYHPLMLRNARKSFEIEVIRGNTERAKEIALKIPESIELIKQMVSGSLQADQDRQKVAEAINALHKSCSKYLINDFGWSKSNFSDSENFQMLLGIRKTLNEKQRDLLSSDKTLLENQEFTSQELVALVKDGLCLKPDDEVDPV